MNFPIQSSPVAVFQEPGAVPSTKCTLSVKSLISVDSAPQNPDRVHEICRFRGYPSHDSCMQMWFRIEEFTIFVGYIPAMAGCQLITN